MLRFTLPVILLLGLCVSAPVCAELDVPVERAVVYRTLGGRSLKLDVFSPRARGTARPAVLCVHGGGWRNGERRQMYGKAAALARAGIVGVAIEYRKSDEATYPAAVDDTFAAVQWVRANAARLGVDPGRIGVFGSSAGGHLALMAGVTKPGRPVQAVASWNGPGDLVRGFMESGHVSKYARDVTERFLGGPIATHRVLYERASPARNIIGRPPPLFLVHGEEDGTVPPSQGDYMAEAARRAGGEVTILRVRNAGHIIGPDADPPESEVWARTLSFFRRALR
jgi:acetyl esterase/lipase